MRRADLEDGDWDEILGSAVKVVAALKEHRVMSRRDVQRAVLSSEAYWFGAELGAPKVYDSGTNFNAPPTLRGGESERSAGAVIGDTGRSVRYESTEDGWEVVFDED